MRVIILTNRQVDLDDFALGLSAEIEWVEQSELVLQQASSAAWDLLVIDALLSNLDYKKLLMDLLRVNAMLNTVVITDLGESDFHEASEGLGVLSAVPARPTREHGIQIMGLLRQILDMYP